MVDVVLFQPEIPPNAGNVIRLCANTATPLHLVEPLGFSMADRQLKRAGLDYALRANVWVHADWAACRDALAGRRLRAFTTRSSRLLGESDLAQDDVLVFGPETAGLPEPVLSQFAPADRIRLPMIPGNRSINLSNAVAVAVYEAWRRAGYPGGG
ncbi:MAG: tRNA (cytidine(34)-2'-O)-methyltransferase [Betaproteobacteria bacterium]|nr:tRNA (cytidine(34)-2'-O)-methyltransferase [Betaproteobacteria bacterium]